jgi:metal-responsive CopG/Arc/MetJ family transcriptional regulator
MYLPDELLAEIVAAVEDSDQEENVSRFIRVAIRAEIAARKKAGV